MFQELSRIGYKQVEFAGFSQHANAEGGNVNNVAGAQLLRTWLDENGLEAEGNHGSIPSTISDATIAAFDAQCEIANILGFGHIGTGNDPTGSAYVADWELAADRWNFFGERAASHGLKLYTHNHDIAYSFLLDSGPLDALGRPDAVERHPSPGALPREHRPELRVPGDGHLLGARGPVQAAQLHRT